MFSVYYLLSTKSQVELHYGHSRHTRSPVLMQEIGKPARMVENRFYGIRHGIVRRTQLRYMIATNNAQ